MKTREMIASAGVTSIVGIAAIAMAVATPVSASNAAQTGGSSSSVISNDDSQVAASVRRVQVQTPYQSTQVTNSVSGGIALNGYYGAQTKSGQKQSTDDASQKQRAGTMIAGSSQRDGFAASTASNTAINTDDQQTSNGKTSAVASGDSASTAKESNKNLYFDL